MTVKELIEALQKLPQDREVHTSLGAIVGAEKRLGVVLIVDDYDPDSEDY